MPKPTPAYQVLKSHDGFEIRLYGSETLVDANIQTPFIETGRKGFRRLYRYITGQNRTQQRIAMTVPILTAPVTPQTYVNGHTPYTLQFFLPHPWTIDTAPLPHDHRLSLNTLSARKIAVLRYNGFWSYDNFTGQAAKLQDKLKQANLETLNAPVMARYNGPNTLWFMRRNEVWIEIA